MEKIGKYELLGKIGTGGFGVVYKGRDPFIKRFVAVKTCSSEDEEMRRRFFREAEIAGNLHHRNVTTVYDFGFQGEVPYLVQEFLSGEDLDQIVKRRDHLPDAIKIDYLAQIAAGLEYAHAQGVVHRDIKPSNIRILDTGRVKIMDFGIAKLTHVESQLTRTGTTLGTSSYLAPEQIKGEEVTAAVDIFSFGVVAYELLTYQRPFEGQTISSLFYKILSHEPEPVQSLWLSCSDELAAVVHRCLQKEPSERYASMTDVLADLTPLHERARIATADSDAQPTRNIVLPSSADGLTATLPVPPSQDQVEALQKRVDELLEAGNHTAAEVEVTLARKRHGTGSGFDTAVAPILDRIARTRKERDDERRRGEKLRTLLDRSQELDEEGNLEEALLVLRAARELAPEEPEVSSRLESLESRVQAERQERERQEEAQEIARLLEEGQLDDASEALETLAADPAAADLVAPLRDRLDLLERRRQIRDLTARAREALDAGRLGEAADLANEGRALDAQDRDLRALVDEIKTATAREKEAERQESKRQEAERQVRAALRAGEVEAARSLLDAAARELPDDPTWRTLQSELDTLEAQRREERDKAWERTRRAVRGELERRDFAGARRQVERARIELGDDPRLAELAEAIDEQETRERQERLQEILDEAEEAVGAGRFDAARTGIEEARTLAPKDSRVASVASALAEAERRAALETGLREAGDLLDRDDIEPARQLLESLRNEHGADDRLTSLEARIDALAEARDREAIRERLEAARGALEADDLDGARSALAEAKAVGRTDRGLAELEERIREAETERARQIEAERRRRAIERAGEELEGLLAAGSLKRAEKALASARSDWPDEDWAAFAKRLAGLREREEEARRARREALLRSPALRFGGLAAVVAILIAVAVAYWPESPPATTDDPVAATEPASQEEAGPVEEAKPETSGSEATRPEAGEPDVGEPLDTEPGAGTEEQVATDNVPPAVEPPEATEPEVPAEALQLAAAGRRSLDAGRTGDALSQALRALSLAPGLDQAENVRDRAVRAAAEAARQASRRAAAAGADDLAPADFGKAQDRFRQAERDASGGRWAEAHSGYEASTRLYRDAGLAAEREAARRERERVAREEADRAPATPEPTVPEPPADETPAAPTDEERIASTLTAYESAMESRQVAALRRVYPSVPGAMVEALGRYRRLEIDLSGCDTSVQGNRATVRCDMRQVVVPEAGGEQTIERGVRFELERSGEGWIIASRAIEN